MADLDVILATIAVGAYLRFRNLGQIPPGLHFDEAANGMDGLNVWKGQLHIFFPANNGREPLFLYLVAVAVRIFGNTAAGSAVASGDGGHLGDRCHLCARPRACSGIGVP